MTRRKDRLKALFTADAGEGAETPNAAEAGSGPGGQAVQPPAAPQRATPRSASGAVKAMGLSLGQMAQDLDEARKRVEASGDRVITLDPKLIDAAIIPDRLSSGALNDDSFEALKDSMRTAGQQVPVLVRPHPEEAKRGQGRYQAAYGHRRIQAAVELGFEVTAIVRELTDEELVLAQGKENAERRNLSFIERAFFARRLMDHGFDRATVQDALGVHKTEMTRLLQVADRIPIRFARAIGPAPKAGRPRWLQLGDYLARPSSIEIATDEVTSGAFLAADSDQRFQRLFTRLARPKKPPRPRQVKGPGGRLLAEVRGSVFTLAKDAPEGFADYLADELPGLAEAFAKGGDPE